MMLNLVFLSWDDTKGNEDSILGCDNRRSMLPLFVLLTARRTAGSAYGDMDPQTGEPPGVILLSS